MIEDVASPMRAQPAPDVAAFLLVGRAQASPHLGEAAGAQARNSEPRAVVDAPSTCGWGQPYLLDWDNQGRSETITAQTPSGKVVDGPRTFSNFSGGVYAVYVIRGSVDFVFKQNVFPNAVVSAVFFGPATASTATALPATSLLVDTAGCPSCGGGGGLSQVVAETDQNGNLTAYYVRVGDKLLSVMRPGSQPGTWTTRYIHEDGLGSVRALTDETGTVVDTRGYEAFGTKNVEAGSDPLSYGFAGEPLDPTSHLAYHRARWMDPRVGRFVGMDSVDGDVMRPLSLHRYVYVGDDPADRKDPSGQDGIDAEGVINFQQPTHVGTGSAGITGPGPFTDALSAIRAALESDWRKSQQTPTGLVQMPSPINAIWQLPTKDLHAEYGGLVYALPGNMFRYSYSQMVRPFRPERNALSRVRSSMGHPPALARPLPFARPARLFRRDRLHLKDARDGRGYRVGRRGGARGGLRQ